MPPRLAPLTVVNHCHDKDRIPAVRPLTDTGEGYRLWDMPATTTTLTITGMSCSHCVAAVTRHLNALDGVTVRDVQIGRAVIDADPSRVTPEALAAAVDAAGFTLDPVPASLAPDAGQGA